MIRVNTRGLNEAFEEAREEERKIPENIREVLGDILVNDMLRDAKINARGKVIGRHSGRSTGHLSRHIFHKMSQRRDLTIGSLYVDLNQVPYGRIHELGGVITPKRAQFLTIPFPGIKGFPRDFKNVFFEKGVMFEQLSDDYRALFALKKQVRIPRRPYIEPAIKKHKIKLQTHLKKKLNKE